MTTYAIKVQNTMRSTNPRYNTEGPMTLYHYIGKNGWMSGQSLYEGYSTLRGAKIGLAAYMKQHDDFIKNRCTRTGSGRSCYRYCSDTKLGLFMET